MASRNLRAALLGSVIAAIAVPLTIQSCGAEAGIGDDSEASAEARLELALAACDDHSLEMLTDRVAHWDERGRIPWGSRPGTEIEESLRSQLARELEKDLAVKSGQAVDADIAKPDGVRVAVGLERQMTMFAELVRTDRGVALESAKVELHLSSHAASACDDDRLFLCDEPAQRVIIDKIRQARATGKGLNDTETRETFERALVADLDTGEAGKTEQTYAWLESNADGRGVTVSVITGHNLGRFRYRTLPSGELSLAQSSHSQVVMECGHP